MSPVLSIRNVATGVACAVVAACGGSVHEGSPSPTARAKQIGIGREFSCALMTDGSVRCWGGNSDGELGNGVDDEQCSRDPRAPACSLLPQAVVGVNDGVQLGVGGWHACALRASGDVVCWGRNDWGQLGDGTSLNRTTPVGVVGLPQGVVEVKCGAVSTCVRTDVGVVWCWGNDYLQLPDPMGGTTAHVDPRPAPGVANATKLALGFGHTCALVADGSVECWGQDTYCDYLVQSMTEFTATPAPVPGLTNVRDISAEDEGTVVVLADGSVTTTIGLTCPNPHPDVHDAAHAGGGGDIACYVDAAGVGHCLGTGILGDGSGSQQQFKQFVTVAGFGGLVQIAAGSHTCALSASGEVRCWGGNLTGEVGDGTRTERDVPTGVRF